MWVDVRDGRDALLRVDGDLLWHGVLGMFVCLYVGWWKIRYRVEGMMFYSGDMSSFEILHRNEMPPYSQPLSDHSWFFKCDMMVLQSCVD